MGVNHAYVTAMGRSGDLEDQKYSAYRVLFYYWEKKLLLSSIIVKLSDKHCIGTIIIDPAQVDRSGGA